MPVVASRSSRRSRHSLRAAAAAASGNGFGSLPVPKPFRWYVDWVRANEENAQSLERLSRTFAMILSDPSDLVMMEGCWTATKVHTFVNQAIVQTGYQSVSASDALTYILRAVQELECLGELLLRKYCHQRTSWNVLLALQAVKCVLNMCVHRQLFLMPWVWQSIRLYVRRVLRALSVPRYFFRLAGETPSTRRALADGENGGDPSQGNAVSNDVHGQTIGPSGARLVIPRVVSNRRQEHRHYFNPSASGDEDSTNEPEDEEEAWVKEEAEAIPFTFIDVLGMVVDAFVLVRPVLVLAAARHVFPLEGGDAIGRIPSSAPAAPANATEAGKAKESAADKGSKTAETAVVEQDPLRVLRATMEACTPQQTLFASWRWWAVFAGLDALVVLISRYIKAHRIPVVYISDPSAAQLLLESPIGSETTLAAGEGGEDEEAAAATAAEGGEDDGAGRPTPGAEGEDNDNANNYRNSNNANGEPVISNVPAVVSRDSLRQQQALRNMAYTFLRDPFFTVVVKRFIYDNFVNGFINRIPLLGSLVGFQVGYFLSMQHYSFMYSIGQ